LIIEDVGRVIIIQFTGSKNPFYKKKYGEHQREFLQTRINFRFKSLGMYRSRKTWKPALAEFS